jgi:hypothetical protein
MSLPPITDEGLETFGYLADGKLRKGCVEYFNGEAHQTDVAYDSIFQLSATCDEYTLVILLTANIKLEENITYQLSGADSRMKYIPPSGKTYYSDISDLANAEIKFHKVDYSNQIISGTFSGSLISEEGNSVAITEGRFDQKFR